MLTSAPRTLSHSADRKSTATRRECLYKTSGCDRTCTLVIHGNDAIRADYAFRHLEGRRDRAVRKQPLSSAQRERIYHQPEHIDQIMLHKRLKEISISPNV